jgi:fatty acid desaturase
MTDFRIWRFLSWAAVAYGMFYLSAWGMSRPDWWGFPTFMIGFFSGLFFMGYGFRSGIDS